MSEFVQPDRETRRQRRAHLCFGCSPDNPIGLKLEFRRDGEDRVCAETILREELCGWDGVAHGGIVSLLIDEVTSWTLALCGDGQGFATRSLSVRFLRPTPTSQPLHLEGRILKDEGRLVQLQGEVRLADGRLCARGAAEIVRLDPAAFKRFAEQVQGGQESP